MCFRVHVHFRVRVQCACMHINLLACLKSARAFMHSSKQTYATQQHECMNAFTNVCSSFPVYSSDTPLIDHLVMREFVSGSPSTSVTVYTKHVHVMFNQQTVSSLQTLGTCTRNLKRERAPKELSFLKELCSKSANCSRTFPKTRLSVTNSLVYEAVARRSAHELSHV